MKHFYNVNSALTVTRPAANALGTALGSTMKLFTLVLLSFFLLVSGEGFGQVTFTAKNVVNGQNANNNWRNPEVWGFNGNTVAVEGVSYPGPNDYVIIQNSAAVVVNSNVSCYSLKMDPKTGGGTPGLTIGAGHTLTATNLEILVDNMGINAKAAIRVSGTLIVNGTVTLGGGKFDFICGTGSTVEYRSTTQLIAPQTAQDNQINIAGNYYNLKIAGGTVTMPKNVTVEGDLSLTSGGKLNTGTNTTTSPATPYILTLAESAKIATPETATEYITGRVQATRTIATVDPNTFGNLGVAATLPSGSSHAITVTRTTGSSFNFSETEGPTTTNKTTASRYFEVTTSTGQAVTGLNMTFDFLTHEINTSAGNYGLYHRTVNSTTGVPAYALVTASGNPVNQKFFASNVKTTGQYTIAPYTPPVPLPVELVSFKAQRHTQGVSLAWMTASEQDNSGFEVQVSTDSKTFEKIGFVKSEVGTTSIAQHYSFLDTKAMAGTRYYRLAQIDLDGTTTYSSIQAVALDGGNGEVAAYPNPFEDVVIVKLNGVESRKVKTILATAHGLIILQREVEVSGSTLTIDTSHVTAKGIYILHVMESDGTKHTIKLMKE